MKETNYILVSQQNILWYTLTSKIQNSGCLKIHGLLWDTAAKEKDYKRILRLGSWDRDLEIGVQLLYFG